MAKKHRDYDNDFPSVTQILDQLRKPALEMWFKKNTLEFINAESAKSREIGTLLHEAIQSNIELSEVKIETQYTEEIVNALKSFMEFKKDYPNMKLKRAEIQMTSVQNRCNGTLDCLGNDGEEVVFDWKTGKCKDDIKPAIYDEYFIQVAAYVAFYNELNHADISKAYILVLAKDKVSYNIEPITKPQLQIGFEIFLNLLDIFKNKKLLTALRKEQ
jgi:hypothetical protein